MRTTHRKVVCTDCPQSDADVNSTTDPNTTHNTLTGYPKHRFLAALSASAEDSRKSSLMHIEDFSLESNVHSSIDSNEFLGIGRDGSKYRCAKEVETRELIVLRGPMRPSVEARRTTREVSNTRHPSTATVKHRSIELCNTIRSANTLVIELDGQQICTNHRIEGPQYQTPESLPVSDCGSDVLIIYANPCCFRGPYCTVKAERHCLRHESRKPVKDHDYHTELCEPILCDAQSDECIYYPIDPWTLIDAILEDDSQLIHDYYRGVNITYLEAQAKFHTTNNRSVCGPYWRFNVSDTEVAICMPVSISDDESILTDDREQPHDDPMSAAATVTTEPPIQGVLIEYCCEEDSELCKPKYTHTENGTIRAIRLTERTDMTTNKGLEYALSIVQRYKHLPIWLWSSIPCTGGSSIQALNKRRPKHRHNIEAHNRIFKRLHQNLMVLARETLLHSVEGHFTFEWPKSNTWWRRPEIRKMLTAFNMQSTTFDGCALGVVSENNKPMLKPWRLASTSIPLLTMFAPFQCPNKSHEVGDAEPLPHVHARIQGGTRARDSARYPPTMAEKVHQVFRRQCLRFIALQRESSQAESDIVEPAAACTDSTLPLVFDMDELWIIDTGSGRNLMQTLLSLPFEGSRTSAPTVTLNTGAGLIKCKSGLQGPGL